MCIVVDINLGIDIYSSHLTPKDMAKAKYTHQTQLQHSMTIA
jgi:hypothetical protein